MMYWVMDSMAAKLFPELDVVPNKDPTQTNKSMANLPDDLWNTHIFIVDISLTGAAKQLPPQEVAIILQEGQVEVAEEFHMFVLHTIYHIFSCHEDFLNFINSTCQLLILIPG